MKKLLKNLIILSLLSSCASIPDTEVCVRLIGGKGAHCKTLKSEKTREISEDEWVSLEKEYLYLHIEQFGDLKKFFKKYCKLNPGCL